LKTFHFQYPVTTQAGNGVVAPSDLRPLDTAGAYQPPVKVRIYSGTAPVGFRLRLGVLRVDLNSDADHTLRLLPVQLRVFFEDIPGFRNPCCHLSFPDLTTTAFKSMSGRSAPAAVSFIVL